MAAPPPQPERRPAVAQRRVRAGLPPGPLEGEPLPRAVRLPARGARVRGRRRRSPPRSVRVAQGRRRRRAQPVKRVLREAFWAEAERLPAGRGLRRRRATGRARARRARGPRRACDARWPSSSRASARRREAGGGDVSIAARIALAPIRALPALDLAGAAAAAASTTRRAPPTPYRRSSATAYCAARSSRRGGCCAATRGATAATTPCRPRRLFRRPGAAHRVPASDS